MELSWERHAACRGLDSSIFFPADDEQVATAKAVCGECPVSDSCLEHAIAHRERDGVWGGMTAVERQRMIRRMRRQRRLQLVTAS